MITDDPLLPAAPHLVGPDATALLRVAVNAADGELLEAEVCQVQYRPGHDLVVRFDATVRWRDGEPKPETLLAGVTVEGAFPGTLPLEAGDLVAGVWRYPYDPFLPGLARAVTPRGLAALVGDLTADIDDIDVRVYRPIRRSVVRVRDRHGREVYVKVVRPREAAAIVDRHHQLAAAGLPVPQVLRADVEAGIVIFDALAGRGLRAQLLDDVEGWPPPGDYVALLAGIARVPVTWPSEPRSLLRHTVAHAEAVATVVPRLRPRLDDIIEAVRCVPDETTSYATTIHGDFYEAQLMVSDGRLSGLLDLDDVRTGHRLEDPANLLAHLHILQPTGASHRARLVAYRRRLRAALGEGHDLPELDRRTAGALVGLATGPFRAQSSRWRAEVTRRLRMASRLVNGA